MAQFPKAEADIIALANALITGFTDNQSIWVGPPVPVADLQTALDTAIAAQDTAINKRAQSEQATIDKDGAIENLEHKMVEDIRYAEIVVDMDDVKLKLLGWGGRKAPTALAAPGQCRSLEAPREGEGWVFLDWKAPVDGGKVASYRIERRERPAGAWTIAGMEMHSEITLHNQERGKEWEYRVIAANKAGEGEPSNTVMAVL